MPAYVPPVADEREGLLGYLAQQRHTLRVTAHGLTDEQARATPTASELSVGGLIKHVATTERSWMDTVLGRERLSRSEREKNYHAAFRLEPGETLAGVLDLYAEVAAETEEIVAGIPDLGQAVPVPKGVPWFPDDVEAWSVRWVLLHLIEETARHAGHADIIREAVDGATAFPLMAAAEGWPATPWLQPWKPSPPPAR
ncbi:DinB family protein [Planotetraspora sp. A-T 1434]|uniref:DinB family protein n=1 Tax=Planotetraspora sp. A-T 1434 TaxID=2979219 RepID=UPI0021BEDF4E|nr:DinB family protein [Planotetraspora sp. A-T 1434]MCT9930932.1 DinB family protein [Planotetraspora sp. A-T 1434]